MEIRCKTQDYLDLEKLLNFQGNLKKISRTNKEKLSNSIKRLGFIAPIFVWRHDNSNSILDGHQRLIVLRELEKEGESIPLIPVVYIDAANEQEARDMLLHITSQYGEFNLEELEKWVVGIDDIRLCDSEVDFDFSIIDDITIDDDELPVDVEPITQSGDLWELGSHRLICGDCTSIETFDTLMAEAKANLMLTDPPYNVNYQGVNKDRKLIANDNLANESFRAFLTDSFSYAASYLKDGASFYIWHADTESLNNRLACMSAGLYVRQCLIWVKDRFTLSRQDYQWKHEACLHGDTISNESMLPLDTSEDQHEICLYGWKEGTHNWYGNRKQSTVIECPKPPKSAEHPTMKPIDLLVGLIKNSTLQTHIVLDQFLGSGSTLIACEKTNRSCYGSEIDPHYCDVIVRRYVDWCLANNKKPLVRRNGENYEI